MVTRDELSWSSKLQGPLDLESYGSVMLIHIY